MLESIDHGDVREIRLARPPANALDRELLEQLDQALAAAPAERVRALVLSGSPGLYSAGLDVPALLRLDAAGMERFWQSFFAVQQRLARCSVPVIAAITGHSPAGGAVLAMYCDLRIMADGPYRIGLNEVQVGLCPGPLIHQVLQRLVGPRRAEQLLVNGALLEPAAALAAGLVDVLVPPDRVVPEALARAAAMAKLPTAAMRATRAIARADLIALVDGVGEELARAMNAYWFEPSTQSELRALVARLAAKR